MGRKLLAGILGGLAFFTWSSLAHVVLPLGRTGVQEMPNDQAMVAAMKANIKEDGLYFFPGSGLRPTATQSEKTAAMREMQSKNYVGPVGILVYHPAKSLALNPGQLLTEFVTNVVQVLIAVFLLGMTSLAGYMARLRFVTVAGVLSAISTNISYWNFYGFPGNYTLSYILIIALGFVCAGLVVAGMIKPGAGMPAGKGSGA